eukprot:scaffold104960_cov29-Attheya_sp.AAC.3
MGGCTDIDDEATIVTDNTSEGNSSFDTALQAATIDIPKDKAVGDAGATGNFMLPGAPVINIRPNRNPIVINLPDGSQIRSTHTHVNWIIQIFPRKRVKTILSLVWHIRP